MEYCPNGELFKHILSKRQLPEQEARVFFRHILNGISFIHQNNVAHRDMKPENILIDSEGHCKITDFGLAKFLDDSSLTSTACGSPCYASPEILSGKPYNAKQSDMWSVGVILFTMVTGQLPWTKHNQHQLFHQIKRGHYTIPQHVSEKCADLIRKLMNINPITRYTADLALKHPFILAAEEELVEFKEVPIVSLRKVDDFFEKELSFERFKLPVQTSTSKIQQNFAKVKKIIIKKDETSKEEPKMFVKSSISTYGVPISAISMSNTLPDNSALKLKNVLKKVNQKTRQKGKPVIVKPKAPQPV